jgi:hypothetical protein
MFIKNGRGKVIQTSDKLELEEDNKKEEKKKT